MSNNKRRLMYIVGVSVVLFVLALELLSPGQTPSNKKTPTAWHPMAATTGNYSSELTIAPGELPGYTGWARPDTTLAGSISTTVEEVPPMVVTAGSEWSMQVISPSPATQFYVRAYGPAILSGQVVLRKDDGKHVVTLRPVDPGIYTVELIVTFSNPPPIASFPRDDNLAPNYYEGYLVKDFPKQLFVTGESPSLTFKPCTLAQLTISNTESIPRARWKVVDVMRFHPPLSTAAASSSIPISLDGYRDSRHSLGIQLDYQYEHCQLRQPVMVTTTSCQPPWHLILIGDSTMRLQYDYIRQALGNDSMMRVTFIELFGGALRCRFLSGPKITVPWDDPNEQRIVVWNTGLHDIHRLCDTSFSDDRATYLPSSMLSANCVDNYRRAVESVAQDVAASLKPVHTVFQTTHAAWPKWGNYGVSWDPRYGQSLPLDTSFIQAFNTIAVDVLKKLHPKTMLVDGFWVTLPRPDHREVDEMNRIGKKLSHPGIEVVRAMVRLWWNVVVVVHGICE